MAAQENVKETPQGQNVAAKLAEYEKKFQEKDKEIENYKKRVAQLEEELSKAQKLILQSVKEAEEVDSLKTESEKTLTKAKSIIFERTKVIKNQELQIEAYNQQIDSLKDVVRITKDLLEIRNLEVKQLEGKINCMEERMKAEKERQDLLHKKLETMIRHNGELKREYETQLCLFTALRERYNERELARGVIDEITGRGPIQNAPIPAVNDQENAVVQPVTVTEQGSSSNTTVEPVKAAKEQVETVQAVNEAVELVQAVKEQVETVQAVNDAVETVQAVKEVVDAVQAANEAIEAVQAVNDQDNQSGQNQSDQVSKIIEQPITDQPSTSSEATEESQTK